MLSRRSGVSASALRFCERRGLIMSTRSAEDQRLYHLEMLRRISVVRVSQSLGLTLQEISEAMAERSSCPSSEVAGWSAHVVTGSDADLRLPSQRRFPRYRKCHGQYARRSRTKSALSILGAARPRLPYDNSQPPSTSMVVPVTKSFWIMKMIPCATSSAVPARGMMFAAVAFA